MTANASNFDSDLSDSGLPSDRPVQESAQDQNEPTAAEAEAEIRALKAELHQTRLAYQMAIQMAQFQAGFLARTSHELRSPINSVISLHQLILSDLCDGPAEEREFVVQSYGSAQKMLGLLDEVISVSQLVQHTARLSIMPVCLQECLAAVEQATHLQAKNRNLQLEIELPDPTIAVLADERRLQQVLIHLVDMPLSVMQEGYVRVTTQVLSETNQAAIQIEDQRPAECWQDPLSLSDFSGSLSDSLTKPSILQALDRLPAAPSIGLKLWTQRSILELMGGQLLLLETPISADGAAVNSEGITRIQCLLPLATAF